MRGREFDLIVAPNPFGKTPVGANKGSQKRPRWARHPAHRAAESLSKEQSPVPTSPDDALRFAIKVALDAGDYDRASVLLEILKCSRPRKPSE
jgi:hypothetical protein